MAIGDAVAVIIETGDINRQPSAGVEERMTHMYTNIQASNAEQGGFYDGTTKISFYTDSENAKSTISAAGFITNSIYFRKDHGLESGGAAALALGIYQTAT